jgi:Transcription factor WhiB
MTTSAAGAAPLACMVDPDRWFDRRGRTASLEACLRCPARRECAREALRAKATWGMWAGIWIDGTDEPTTRHLRAIAADWPPRPRSGERVPSPAATPRQPAPLPRRRPIVRRSVAVVVDARSSGHCEVMAKGCMLTPDRQLSRIGGRAVRDATCAAEVYCSCRSCADAIDSSTALMRRCGYLVESVDAAPTTLFHWRSARWVLLGTGGELVEISECAAARSA